MPLTGTHAANDTGHVADHNLLDVAVTSALTIGAEIDSSERATPFDVQAVGTTATDVDGLSVSVPATSRPYLIRATFMVNYVTGTAAQNAVAGVILILVDDTVFASPVSVASVQNNQGQIAAATRTYNNSVILERRFEPTATAKHYKIQARLSATIPANWTSVQLFAENLPSSGSYSPMLMTAVGL